MGSEMCIRDRAFTQRYQPKSTSHSPEHSYKQWPESFNVLDPNSPNTRSRSVARSQSSINIQLNSGIPITSIFSDSHKIKSRALNSDQNAYFITLDKTPAVSSKSVDLSWQLLASNQPQISSFTEEILGEHYTLLTFFPPKTEVAKVLSLIHI